MKAFTYLDLDFDSLDSSVLNGEVILLLTATELETRATHSKITPLDSSNKIIRVFQDNLTYYFGKFGLFNIVHVESSMGSMSRASSITTVTTILERLKTKVVIMVGIAFGVDDQEQNIGDVLVSESIIPYNSKKVGTPHITQRGIEAPSSKPLLNRFKSVRLTWEHQLPDNKTSQMLFTRMLSGEELIDNIEYRNSLISSNPGSCGGEMEGAGVFAACDTKAAWIIVKGICDFADGNKGKEKEIKQLIAIEAALSACLELFNSPYAFQEFEIFPSVRVKEENTHNSDNVLFDIYDADKEKYYIKRKDDEDFVQMLTQYGSWIYGPSGSGKTNLIIRNLIRQQKNFIQINLASCVNSSIEEFFFEIYYEIVSYDSVIQVPYQPKNFNDCIKSILNILKQRYLNKELILFIEEIPISSNLNYKEFSEKIFSLLFLKNLSTGLNKVKIVLSSINDPTVHIQEYQQKIHQHLSFKKLSYWTSNDANALISIIEKETNLLLTSDIKATLIQESMGSPRFIKIFFRNVIASNITSGNSFRRIIKETNRDLNQYAHE